MKQTKNDIGIQIRRRIKMNLFGFKTAWNHYRRFARNTNSDYYASQEALMPILIANYHVIEKCLAMPDFELGHAKERVSMVCYDLLKYKELGFDKNNVQYISALQAIDEYDRLHKAGKYNLGQELQDLIDTTLHSASFKTYDQPQISREAFFSAANKPFDEFAISRHSCRAYSEVDIPLPEIEACIDLARTTPTACNRQPNKTYVVTDKHLIEDIVRIQGGGRGFAEKANKLLVITSKTSVFSSFETFETMKAGGMYAMNLLYALHFHHIGACPLEWSDSKHEKKLRSWLQIPDNEEIIILISVGYPLEEFKYVTSSRNSLEDSVIIR